MQLTSKEPQEFQDLSYSRKSLASIGVKNGDMVSSWTDRVHIVHVVFVAARKA